MKTQFICLALVIVLLCPPASAQWVQTNGPVGGRIVAITVDSSGTLYAGAGGGIYSSTDSGTTWSNRCYWGGSVDGIVINGFGHIFAGTMSGVYLSTDNGNSWSPEPLLQSVRTIAIDELNYVYVGLHSAGPNTGVWRSTDNGSTWAQFGSGFNDVPSRMIQSIVVNSQGDVFCGTQNGVFLSVDHGQNWVEVDEGLADKFVFAMETIGADTVFAGTQHGIYRSSNKGMEWTYTLPPNWTSTVQIMCLVANRAGKVAAGTEGYGVLVSTDAGDTWSQPTLGMRQSSFYAVALDSRGDIFAGSYGDGAFKLPSNSSVWQNVKSGMKATLVSSLVSNGLHMFAGTEGGGVFQSVDRGSNWTQDTIGMDYPYVRALAASLTGALFAGTGYGGTGYTGIYASTDTGVSWRPIGLQVTVDCIAVDFQGEIFAGTDASGVFRSTDNGSHWSEQNTGLTSLYVRALVMDSSGGMFAGTWNGIFKSTNHGNNWTQVSASSVYSNALAISHKGYVFAGCSGSGIFRSTDQGASWTQVNTGLGNSYDYGVLALLVDSNNQIFAGLGLGAVFRSTNDGDSWSAMNIGLPNTSVLSFALDSNGYLFAGTEGAGVFRSVSPVTLLPAQVILEYPPQYGIVSGDSVRVGWRKSYLEVSQYWFENSADSLFKKAVVDSTVIDTTVVLHGLIHNQVIWWRVRARNFAGWGEFSQARVFQVATTGIQARPDIPTSYFLAQNYPNPFNPNTTIKYQLPTRSQVTLAVYNTLGQTVATLVNETEDAGYHDVKFDGSNLASGVYFYRIQAGSFVQTKKFLLLR